MIDFRPGKLWRKRNNEENETVFNWELLIGEKKEEKEKEKEARVVIEIYNMEKSMCPWRPNGY